MKGMIEQYNTADEKWGYSNPRRGNYSTYQYFDYLDQGYPKEAAYKFSKQDEQKAQELYEQNNPTHKSYQQGGTLAYTHNRFPITKSLKVNVVYDPKFQPKKKIYIMIGQEIYNQ